MDEQKASYSALLADQVKRMEARHKEELRPAAQKLELSNQELQSAQTTKLNLVKELRKVRAEVFQARRRFEAEQYQTKVALQQIKVARRRTTGLLSLLNAGFGGAEPARF
ncbi:hypothetical protein PHYSODRAFT_306657 [Phytophthora sojae]|uniref:Uncharacterized protein n=1 Tax=Phytophthora sojae (strain P6497) TaxID=1094619 RepID=G5AA59_PHYSP|nr:hypothetical protein PHYSODRAFT_306657 [Phytophthora sojae]EGZ07488.1 hypothetical protein PHYSODRAFT_306657 [Phytophthora sojae]|eukprot:XP_009537054.1 hypothetical protein PHYSODRAFT_306657 [Phytophthora sojae]